MLLMTITRKTIEQAGKDKFCKYLERKKTFEDRLAKKFKNDFDLEDATE